MEKIESALVGWECFAKRAEIKLKNNKANYEHRRNQ